MSQIFKLLLFSVVLLSSRGYAATPNSTEVTSVSVAPVMTSDSTIIAAPDNLEQLTVTSITSKNHHDMSPISMYLAADWVVKSVMIILALASILTWAVFVAKNIQLTIACRSAKKLLVELVASENFIEGEQRSADKQGSGLALIDATRHELVISAKGAASDDGIKERVQIRLERVQADANTKMTSGTGLLATIGSVGPFMGLFGTVWGIMNAFIGIAKSQNTTLAVVAPGIAEALLATAIGLVAAIPAVVIYNHFTRAIGRYRALLSDITAALLVLVSRDLDRKQSAEGSEDVF